MEPVGRDAVIANTWCWVTTASPPLGGEDVAHREAYRDCTVTSGDTRVNGMASERRVIDVAADGTTADAGSLNVTTVDGAWSGTLHGTGDW